MKVGLIKRTVAVVVVSAAAAVGTSGMAFATKNDHRYQHSAEAMMQTNAFSCTDLWNGFEKAVNDAKKADQAGKTKVRDMALDGAAGEVAQAKAQGCEWAIA